MTEHLEEFGIEEFGADVPETSTTVPEASTDPAVLKEQLGEIKKQLAATMDPDERVALRRTEAAIKQQLSAGKNGRKGKQTPEEIKAAAEKIPLPTPESSWQHILLHAKNLGFSAQIVFDELGFTELTAETVGATLREVNRRANPDPEEAEEFVAPGEPEPSGEPAISAEPTITPPSTPVWDDVLNRLTDPETGELISRGYFLEVLGWPELPAELTQEQITQVLDVMHTRFLDPAKRYRDQADKMASALEKKAAVWEGAFGPLFDKYGERHLPKVQKKDSPNFGKYSKKTIDLLTGSISWTKDGGVKCVDEAKFHVWLGERRAEIKALEEQGTDEAKEELEYLKTAYGLRLKEVVDYDRDKIKEAKQLPQGWEVLDTNEFARRTIK